MMFSFHSYLLQLVSEFGMFQWTSANSMILSLLKQCFYDSYLLGVLIVGQKLPIQTNE